MTRIEGLKAEDKKRSEVNSIWYKNWWGIIIKIFLIIMLFLIWRFRSKIKIEVSNCYVALLAVIFSYIYLHVLSVKSRALKVVFGSLWLLLLPNTAYLFTSLGHIVYQWGNTFSLTGHVILLLEYILMGLYGIIVFVFSFSPFEIIIRQINIFQGRRVMWLIIFNFLVAFGLVLGRFQHINSYVVFTNPLRVLVLAINILVSFNLLELTMLFGLLCNVIYFLLRGLLLRQMQKYFHIFDY
jgi:uncharacterized membrane protein